MREQERERDSVEMVHVSTIESNHSNLMTKNGSSLKQKKKIINPKIEQQIKVKTH